MADIFLSYASVDVDRARHLAEVLQQYGSVFWDRTIPTGKTWRQHIGAELESARCLVVAWSEASVESSWVQEEVDDARERATPIFPVFFDGVRAPLGFRSIQGRNLSDWDYTNTFPALQLFLTDVAAFLHSDPSVGRDQGDTDKTHSSPQGDASPPADTTKETLFDRFQSRVEAIPVLRTPLIQALFGGVIFLFITGIIGVPIGVALTAHILKKKHRNLSDPQRLLLTKAQHISIALFVGILALGLLLEFSPSVS